MAGQEPETSPSKDQAKDQAKGQAKAKAKDQAKGRAKSSIRSLRRAVRVSVFLTIAAGFIAVILFIWVETILARPSQQTIDITLQIKRGDGRHAISQRLNQIGIIHHPFVYQIEEWRRGNTYNPRAGEYIFPKGVNLAEAMDIIHNGKAVQHSITIAEGLSAAQVVDLIRADPRLDGELSAIPDEGSLLPETYFFLRHADRNALIKRMQASREIQFAEIWAERHDDHVLTTIQDAVILASIVEKETGRSGERALVASVFLNRLKKGMRLQSDPTVIYGLEQAGVEVDQLHKQLKHDSAWNTYVIKGLPQTPIANPGLASFRAVVHPAISDYYFFVSDGKGGHRFAKTYEGHKANIALWKNSKTNQQ